MGVEPTITDLANAQLQRSLHTAPQHLDKHARATNTLNPGATPHHDQQNVETIPVPALPPQHKASWHERTCLQNFNVYVDNFLGLAQGMPKQVEDTCYSTPSITYFDLLTTPTL